MLKNKRTLNNMTIYQVFVRQFSPTHDFDGVTAQLDRIKSLGADILYLMPFYPIGVVNRKGSVGSPYSIYDYTKIDSANGTEKQFERLLFEAHKRGLKVIIDMVLNHTSRDSVLLQDHNEWFYKKDGHIANRVGDWSDVCDLEYANDGLCDYISDMLCDWVKKGVDGFRMDVCSLVPSKLWKIATEKLHKLNPEIIMLGESVNVGFVREARRLGFNAMSDGEAYEYFDVLYSYDISETQSGFFEKNGSLSAWLKDVLDQEGRYPSDFVKLRYLDNHDRLRIAQFFSGNKLKTLWALNFYLKGTAFIYAGDEVSSQKLNNLFENDEVDWDFDDNEKNISEYLARLAVIKKHPVYAKGFFDVKMQGEEIAVCEYQAEKEKSVGIFNFSGKICDVSVDLPNGEYINLITDKTVTVSNGVVRVDDIAVVIETKI